MRMVPWAFGRAKLAAALSLLLCTIGIGAPWQARADTFFSQTGYSMWGPFETYWNAHGGLAQFGLPRTGVFPAGNGYDAQWFERALFTYHPSNPDPYKVELDLLGNDMTAGRKEEQPFQRTTASGTGHYFAETGHNLSGKFLDYWSATGGLAIYGFPISEQFSEKGKSDGKTYLVQYFERNRFEYHPDLAGTKFEVQLGLLGSELLDLRGGPQAFAKLGTPAYYPQPGGTSVPPGGIVDSPNAGNPGPNPVIPAAPSLPATNKQVLFQADFASQSLDAWQPAASLDPAGAQPATWGVTDGMLWQSIASQESGSSDEALLLARDQSYADSSLDVAFYATAAEAVGAVIRASSTQFYLVKLYPSSPNSSPKASLLRAVPGGASVIVASSQAWAGYQRGAWHLLNVTAIGATITASVDGQQVLRVDNLSAAPGTFGLYTYADGTTRFDNLRVTAP